MSNDNRAVGRGDLDAAAKDLASQGKAFDPANVWDYLVKNAPAVGNKLDLANIIMSVGGFLMIVALPIMLGLVADMYKYPVMLTGAAASIVVFGLTGYTLWHKYDLKVPGGLLTTVAVAAVPVATWGFLNEFLQATEMAYNAKTLIIFGSAAAASMLALQAVRWPFLTMPLFGSLWVMASVIVDMVAPNGNGWFFGWASKQALILDMVFGALLMATAFSLEKSQKEDYSFWGYLFGLSTFWFAWTQLGLGGEAGKLLFVAVNLGFILLSAMLKRTIFLVFGVVGSFWYPFYLVAQIPYFANNPLMFWGAVTAIGATIVGLGAVYLKNRDAINGAVTSVLPKLR